MILKEAKIYESTGVVDPRTKLPIRTTVRARKAYRQANPDEILRWYDNETGEIVDGPRKGMPNYYVSQAIEREMASSYNGVPEDGYFKLRDGSLGEIRFMVNAAGQFNVFISSIKDGSVDVISFQSGYLKKPAKASLSGPSWYYKRGKPSWLK